MIAGAATAQPDESAARLHIVVQYPRHRLCDATFRRRFQTDLHSLIAANGLPCRVSDVEKTNKLPGLVGRAFDRGLDALDAEGELHPEKLHLVQLTVNDGQIEAAARQHDGSTGLASPAVRRSGRVEKHGAARAVAGLIEPDYGAVADVVASIDEATVRVRWRAADVAPVQRGDVLLLAQVTPGSPGQGRRVPGAVLQVARVEDDECVCHLHHRYDRPLDGFPRFAYRGLRIAPAAGSVSVRVCDEAGRPHTQLGVRLYATGYGPTDTERERGALKDGRYDSERSYDRLAFLKVTSGERVLARLPVEVAAGGVRVVVVRAQPEGEREQQAEQDALYLLRRGHDVLRRLHSIAGTLSPWLTEGENGRAFQFVQAELARLDRELPDLDRAAAAARPATPAARAALDDFKDARRAIADQADKLRATQRDLEDALKQEGSPEATAKRQARLALMRRADTERDAAEFDKAIATYEELLRLHGEWPEARRRHDALTAGWAIKSPDHAAARALIYGLAESIRDADDVRTKFDSILAAFATCKAAGDKLTPVKLLREMVRLADLLARRRADLATSAVERDRTEVRQIDEVVPKLRGLLLDLEAFVK